MAVVSREGELSYTPLIFENKESEATDWFIKQYRPDEIVTIDTKRTKNLFEAASSFVLAHWKQTKNIVLVDVSSREPLGLLAAPLASLLSAPLLWITSKEVPKCVIEAIVALGVENVVIVRGPTKLPDPLKKLILQN